ncbi:MAG: ABC transporter ATP-binding protein [Candidatus Heimdallarchaeota archaeon]|nr:ABC transporter ATP-binding protein [Candidatus Heimdallarchaeota archaeon]MCK5142816.1 ABC transporter ATP-binding protein [Candidatus Heimdallarchaeota archaeon]
MTFIEVRDLIKIYHTKEFNVRVPALRGIELEINQGEFISIIGPSGSGKTTLLLVLAGMTEPSAGQISVGGVRLDQLTEDSRSLYRRYKVGTLWQIPNRNLIWEINILENVEIPMRLLGIPREQRKKDAKELLSEVGLAKRLKHKPSQLSGGEVQRAGLACALAHNPILLLADEPTGELDSKTAGELLKYFKHLNETHGITAIMVTHDFDVAKSTDKLIQIVDGRISGYSPTEKLKTIRDMHHVYLDRYGGIQLPRHVIDKLRVQQEIFIDEEDGKVVLHQNNSNDVKKAKK